MAIVNIGTISLSHGQNIFWPVLGHRVPPSRLRAYTLQDVTFYTCRHLYSRSFTISTVKSCYSQLSKTLSRGQTVPQKWPQSVRKAIIQWVIYIKMKIYVLTRKPHPQGRVANLWRMGGGGGGKLKNFRIAWNIFRTEFFTIFSIASNVAIMLHASRHPNWRHGKF